VFTYSKQRWLAAEASSLNDPRWTCCSLGTT